MLETQTVQCPYCWETIEIVVDLSIGEQEYIEDCSVCCNPITFHIIPDGFGGAEVQPFGQEE